MSQYDISETGIKCHVCNGAGYHLVILGHETIERKCGACDGTGLTEMGRAMQEFGETFKGVFICEKCGANKVHYRLYGYRCPNHCEDEL